jgi:uroporphyrinogen-III synthase
MRVLVTRPREDAAPLVAALEARGHEVLVEPLLTIVPRADAAWPAGHDAVQALLVTSANGLRAFAAADPRRDLKVFAVGEASAAEARAAGFTRVAAAAGDVDALARLVIERADPAAGALLHPAAGRLAGDLQGLLAAAGFTVLRVVLYDAVPATRLTSACREAFSQELIDAVTFFSPRTAATFVSLIERGDLAENCRKCAALCLSAAVAAQLSGLPWRRVVVAVQPDQASLLAALDGLDGKNS